jgi:hypothetical protein
MNMSLLFEVIRAVIYGLAALVLVTADNHGFWLFFGVGITGLFFSNLILIQILRVQAIFAYEQELDDDRGHDGKETEQFSNR